MKKVKFLMFALAIAAILSSCTENAISPATDQTLSASQVPSAVQATLASSFPTATATTWSKASPTVSGILPSKCKVDAGEYQFGWHDVVFARAD